MAIPLSHLKTEFQSEEIIGQTSWSCVETTPSSFSLRRAVCLNFSSGLKNMFVSRFYRLGSYAFQKLVKAPVFRRLSVLPGIHHQYLQTQVFLVSQEKVITWDRAGTIIHHVRADKCGIGYQRDELFSTAAATLDSEEGNETEQKINVTFVDKDGEETNIKVPVGMSMLEAAHENDLDLEGACEASLACSTCHVIVMDMSQYNKIPDPTDEENDMLDLAFGLTETSRLGCQIIATPELDGIRLAIPSATRNFAVDGYKPKPH